MNSVIFVGLFVLAVAAGMEIHPDDPHNHETLPDEAEIQSRMDCIHGRGPCSDMMKDYLKVFPTAIQNACASCSPEMKLYLREVFRELKMNYADDFEGMKKKYDPEGKYFDALEAAIAK